MVEQNIGIGAGRQAINRTCDVWKSEVPEGQIPKVYNSIKFHHEAGEMDFIPLSAVNESVKNGADYPAGTLYVSNSNWVLDCDTVNPQRYRVRSPNGITYYFNPSA